MIGNPCSAGARVAPELFLPAGTTPAIDATHPVKCWYGNIGAVGVPWTWIQIVMGCPQAPVLGVRGGLGFYVPGQSPSWPTATGKAVELQIPVKSTETLGGILNSTGDPPSLCHDCLTGAVWFMDGQYSPWAYPQAGVLVGGSGASTPLISYPNPSTTNITTTTATATTTVSSAGTTGSVFVEEDETPPGGSTCVQTSNVIQLNPAGTYTYPITFTQLTPGTTYYWRVCYVTGGVTYWGNTQSFTTLGAAKPTIFAVTPGIALPQDTVVLTGTHLTGATNVAVVSPYTGVVPATFTPGADPDHSLRLTVPGGGAQGYLTFGGHIRVTTPGGVAETTNDFLVGIDTILDSTTVYDQEASGQKDDVKIMFHTSEPFAGAECNLDNGPLTQSCSDFAYYYDLAPGVHHVSIKARQGSYFDFSPAVATFTVVNADTTPPNTTVLTGPSGVYVASTSATFTFSSSEANSTFQCRNESNGLWQACSTPRTLTGLAQGQHIFAVRAKDFANNVDPTPEYRGWIVDTIPPDTAIWTGPASGSATKSTTATFQFFGWNAPLAGFDCKLDAGAFAPCMATSAGKIYTGLANGPHTFGVRARDRAGNIDATPASRTWTVDPNAPSVVKPGARIALRQLDPTGVPAQVFWSGSDGGGSGIAAYALRESVDGGDWNPVPIASPLATELNSFFEPDVSTHAFDVQATDRAGNVSVRSAGAPFTAGLYEDGEHGVVYSRQWGTEPDDAASGGSLHDTASRASAWFSIPAGTTSVGWVSTTGLDRGIATVWLDGAQVATVDLYSADELHQDVVFSRLVTPSVAHTLRIDATGTANVDASGVRVDVDAFALLHQ